MPDPRSLLDMRPSELVAYAAKIEDHARSLANRMMFLESVIARALHAHAVAGRVCVCRRCIILRTALRKSAPGDRSPRDRSRSGDVSLSDDPDHA